MSKTLILLAGYPATGKSTLCKKLQKIYENAAVIAPDDIKEEYWDRIGFNNAQEKATLEIAVWKTYYDRLIRYMESEQLIITDYPFSNKQKPTLKLLCKLYEYQCITVRFVGDLKEIYKRSLARDLDQKRHLGHLMNHYHKGDYLENRLNADVLVSYDLLRYRCRSKGYGAFCLGTLLEVDATYVEKIDFEEIIIALNNFISQQNKNQRSWFK